MAAFRPIPFGALCRRMLREAERGGPIFDLSPRRFVLHPNQRSTVPTVKVRSSKAPEVAPPDRDISIDLHGRVAATPLGPAAGPHTQLAQNIVLSFLAGGRTMELKTVQVKDELELPRPCIDARTVGYNVEWSQELKLEQSLEEYVKASMLLEILAASGHLALAPGFERTVFEASVGYDLEGVKSPRVQAFLAGLQDARPVIDRLRGQIPDEHARYRDLEFRADILGGVTLSTFHGCPPGEVERIAELLLQRGHFPVVLKLNPTLLGSADLRRLLHDEMGYHDIVVPEGAFTRDLGWDDALALVERTRQTAAARGRGMGIKLTNTLVVENRGGFLPATEKEAYLSGAPLHVLAIELTRRARKALGAEIPVSFSAGIDAHNFADAVALGLTPVTVCTDWLKSGGYGRAQRYFEELGKRMDAAFASTREDFILLYHDHARAALDRAGIEGKTRLACERALDRKSGMREAAGDRFARWVAEAAALNTEAYADRVIKDPRYGAAQNGKPPKKLGKHLTLLDCVACDKCVPVCPNDANFTLVLPERSIERAYLDRTPSGWVKRDEGEITLGHDHQIANIADACNECGNCDVICPEEGGPYVVKPRFFLSEDAFMARPDLDGFWIRREGGEDHVVGRVSGARVEARFSGETTSFSGSGFSVTLDLESPEATIEGEATAPIDLGLLRIIDGLRRAVLDGPDSNFVNSQG